MKCIPFFFFFFFIFHIFLAWLFLYQLQRLGSFGSEVSLIALMMEAATTCETSVHFYQTTRRNNPEDCHLHTRRRVKLKSHYNKLCQNKNPDRTPLLRIHWMEFLLLHEDTLSVCMPSKKFWTREMIFTNLCEGHATANGLRRRRIVKVSYTVSTTSGFCPVFSNINSAIFGLSFYCFLQMIMMIQMIVIMTLLLLVEYTRQW
jgi:hypothetical protein